MRRSKDALTASTTSILMPSLRPYGFIRLTNRTIARERNHILQFIYLQLSSWGGRTFCVNYVALLLFKPRDHFVLQPGGRLRVREGGPSGWWDSDTHDNADKSMNEITSLLIEDIVPWFDYCQTVKGLNKLLAKERWGSDHHLEFEKACCLAYLGKHRESKRRLKKAISLYKKDGREWCSKYIQQCQELLDSIDEGTNDYVMSEWVEYSIRNLRLSKLPKS